MHFPEGLENTPLKKKSFGSGQKNAAPIPILLANNVTDTEFWSHTNPDEWLN